MPVAALLVPIFLLAACAPSETFSVTMQDSSMEPTFTAHTVIRFRRAAQAARGNVIAFDYPFLYPGRPPRELVTRVIGLPGDRLELAPGRVLRNGEPLAEPYAKNLDRMAPQAILVPPRTYFVLGDDRANQRDSRWWGPLPASKLLGIWLGG